MKFERQAALTPREETPEASAYKSVVDIACNLSDNLDLDGLLNAPSTDCQVTNQELLQLSELSDPEAESLLQYWRESVIAGVPLLENIEPTVALERLAPGSVAYLHQVCNIAHFGRYPLKLLLAMFEQRHDQSDWGILVYAKHDHNNALYDEDPLNEMMDALGTSYKMRVVECGSAQEAAEMMQSMANRYGKASFAVFSAHGSSKGISLSGGNEPAISKDSLREEFGDVLDRSLEAGAEICIAACSTGSSDGVGETMSIESGHDAVAPDEDSGLESFGASISFGRVTFHPRFRGAATRKMKSDQLVEQHRHLQEGTLEPDVLPLS